MSRFPCGKDDAAGSTSRISGNRSPRSGFLPRLRRGVIKNRQTALIVSLFAALAMLLIPSLSVSGAIDFDIDGKTDAAVWRPGDGTWYILRSSDGGMPAIQWGSNSLNDVLVPGDYDGDGKTDAAVWRPGDGTWWVQRSSDGAITGTQWGSSSLNDVAVPGDYDGDQKTDAAVWRPGDSTWYILRSSDGGITGITWGSSALNDVLVPGDYDGDGKTDVAVWRPGDGTWWVQRSSDGGITGTQWGSSSLNDVAVPGDYDGDQKTDAAVWRPGDSTWYILRSSDGGMTTIQWGSSALNDVLVPGDYDGDLKTDAAVWRPNDGTWWILRSSDGGITGTQWGSNALSDVPITSLVAVATPSPPPLNLNGTWVIVTNETNNDCGDGIRPPTDTEITQTGNQLSVFVPVITTTFTGQVSGNFVEWGGNFFVEGGTENLSFDGTVDAGGNVITGTENYNWSDGVDFCSGTTDVTITRKLN